MDKHRWKCIWKYVNTCCGNATHYMKMYCIFRPSIRDTSVTRFIQCQHIINPIDLWINELVLAITIQVVDKLQLCMSANTLPSWPSGEVTATVISKAINIGPVLAIYAAEKNLALSSWRYRHGNSILYSNFNAMHFFIFVLHDNTICKDIWMFPQ